MKITHIFFDLDGTLLPMDQDIFAKAYFKGMCAKLAPYGYQPEKLVQSIWASTKAMIANTSEETNETVFWEHFREILGEDIMDRYPVFEDFYANDFGKIRTSCGYTPEAESIIQLCHTLGFHTVLATNPIFPQAATYQRIEWAGMKPEDFEYISTYENSTSTKPNPRYYTELLQKLNLNPQECVMIGNDALEDTAAMEAGLQVFLLTDCLINTENRDIENVKHGSFPELRNYIRSLAE